MPLVGLICPDGEVASVDSCLESCRLGERCLTLPTLKLITEEREWGGIASTTQLINGTMLTYLTLTEDYIIDPDSRAFMIQGTKHHKGLEEIGRELGLTVEVPLSVDRDIFDLLEYEDDKLVLTDYKLWGSFKIAKALGIVEIGKMPDPSGAVYKTNSKYGKIGQPKLVPKFEAQEDKADNHEAELQLNRYRIMLKDLGLTVHKLQLQITARDGGLYIAKNRGVMKNFHKIPVKILPDDYVEGYFQTKAQALQEAMTNGWNIPCSPEESWDGIRCESYCDVAEFCPKGRLIKNIGGV